MTALLTNCQNPKDADLCRLCLEKSSNLISLFDFEPLENPLKCPLINKISLCLSVQITHDDKVTTKVCHSCAVKVDEFYIFYNKTAESQKLLAQWEFEVEVQRATESSDKTDFTSVLDGSSEILDGALSLQEEEERGEKRKDEDILKVVDNESLAATFDVDPTTSDTDLLNIDQLALLSQSKVKKKGDTFSDFVPKTNRKYFCSVCPYESVSSQNFKIHMMKHNKEYLVQCEFCAKGFYNKRFYEEHKMTKHSDQIVIFKCSICSKVYHSSSYLKQHLKSHEVQKKFLCETCGKEFKSWKGVKRHDLIEHQNSRYKCDICSKEVNTLQSLNNHRKTHTGEKSYVCKTCGKGFIAMNNLVVHERTHSGEKRYKCDLCDKSFTQSNTLKVHKRHHKGEKPFLCVLCDKRFVTNSLLKTHQKTHYRTK